MSDAEPEGGLVADFVNISQDQSNCYTITQCVKGMKRIYRYSILSLYKECLVLVQPTWQPNVQYIAYFSYILIELLPCA